MERRVWGWLLIAGTIACHDGTTPAAELELSAGADAGAPNTKAAQGWCELRRVLDTRCTACHRAGGVAPFSLESYDDLLQESSVEPGRKVYERIAVRIHDGRAPMPPTGMLDEAELSILDAYIAAGVPAPSGDEGCASQPDAEASWPEHCDATYRILAHAPESVDAPFVVPAGAEIHPKVTVDAPWGDREVQAIAFRPITDNAKVLHHWILNANDRSFLSGWAPGGTGGAPLPDDVGMYMPSGPASMFLDMHYFNLTGTSEEHDQSGVEVCVLEKANFRPHTAGVFRGFGSFGGSDLVLAPAGTLGHEEQGTCNVSASEPVHLLSASPHAHTYAVHMKFEVQKASGQHVMMYDRPFSFDAQGSYELPEQVVLQTGDQVLTTCTYDNDTTRSIRFGESTTDEMCFNFAAYYPRGALSCTRGLSL